MLEVMNIMYASGAVTHKQKRGTLVCIPKKPVPGSPEDYRPLTLLNADYKLLMRIITTRLHPWMNDLLQQKQYCGRQDDTIFDAVAVIRDTVAYKEIHKAPVCLLILDFKEAFDRISHDYLHAIMRVYGFSVEFCVRLKQIYANATSQLTIKGMRSQSIPIRCFVRQGCPLSKSLFVYV